MKRLPFLFSRPMLVLLLLATALALSSCRTTKPKKWYQFWRIQDTRTSILPPEILLPDAPDPVLDLPGEEEALPPEVEDTPMTSIEQTPPIRIEPRSLVSELSTVYFDYNRYDFGGETRRALEENGRWIRQNPGISILIEGHCDSRGSYEYNIHLGQKRADAVREALVSLGVDAGMLSTMSYGEERPADPAETEDAHSKNRRVQFLIY